MGTLKDSSLRTFRTSSSCNKSGSRCVYISVMVLNASPLHPAFRRGKGQVDYQSSRRPERHAHEQLCMLAPPKSPSPAGGIAATALAGWRQRGPPIGSLGYRYPRDTFGYQADTPSDVPWNEVLQGCGQRDCIPSIDNPRFVAAGDADFLADEDIVMVLELQGETRAYPVTTLNYHEIVNYVIAGPLRGEDLRTVPVTMIHWGTWRAAHPDTVLYDDTDGE